MNFQKYNQINIDDYENRHQKIPREKYFKDYWQPIIFEAIRKYCQNKIIVDLGSGTGFYSDYACQFAKSITGIDSSEKMVEYAFKKYPNIKFILGSVLSLPFIDNSIDCALAIGIFEYVNPILLLTEIKRILKNQGYLIIAVPNKYSLARLPAKVFYKFFGKKYLAKEPSKKQMFDLFKKQGFNILEFKMDDGLIWLPDFFDKIIGEKLYFSIAKIFKIFKENPFSNIIFFVVQKND